MDAILYRRNFYENLEKNGFRCDIRNFKGKKVFCPNKTCKINKNGFTLQMQEQVDVAIVMKAMELAYKQELDSLTLVAGDGDFRDCVEFLTKTAKKKVSIFAYEASFNETLT